MGYLPVVVGQVVTIIYFGPSQPVLLRLSNGDELIANGTIYESLGANPAANNQTDQPAQRMAHHYNNGGGMNGPSYSSPALDAMSPSMRMAGAIDPADDCISLD